VFHTDVAYSVFPTTDPTVRAMPANKVIKATLDCLNRIDGFHEYPNLNHFARLGVIGRSGEPGCDNYSVYVLMEDVPV
jgi:hypothetical protein